MKATSKKTRPKKFILRNAFKKGDAWFNTGDALKQIGCGHLQFVDSMGDTYRWKGENVSTTEVENIINGSGLVEEAIVYGIEIPDTNGKAGMVTLVPQQDMASFEPNKLFRYLSDNLPYYAIPVFVRVTEGIEKPTPSNIKSRPQKGSVHTGQVRRRGLCLATKNGRLHQD